MKEQTPDADHFMLELDRALDTMLDDKDDCVSFNYRGCVVVIKTKNGKKPPRELTPPEKKENKILYGISPAAAALRPIGMNPGISPAAQVMKDLEDLDQEMLNKHIETLLRQLGFPSKF